MSMRALQLFSHPSERNRRSTVSVYRCSGRAILISTEREEPSPLDVPITAETRHDGGAVHLLFGPVTSILADDQAGKVPHALRDIARPSGICRDHPCA